MLTDEQQLSNEITAMDLTPPTAPNGLVAKAVSPTQVDLSWRDNSDNETGFKIRRQGREDDAFVTIDAVVKNVTRYSDITAESDTTYTYRVRAFNDAGGAASNDAVVTTPPALAAPSNLMAKAVSPTQVDLSWQDNSDNETGFKIRRQGPQDVAFVTIGAVGQNVTRFSDITVLPGTTYVYRVRAFNGDGGARSNDATVTTPIG
jgi:fibronectin type 3 domain-containing protein